MATGRVLQFDQERGYGFIAADDGGEDVFLHASVFDGDSYELAPGMRMEFKIMAGDRGRKAFAVHLIPDEPDPEGRPAPAPAVRSVAAAQPVPAPAVPAVPAPAGAMPPPVLPAPAPVPPEPAPDEDQMCDVLSQAEFGHELIELLLTDAPGLTGKQIIEVRQGVLEIAQKHGWVDI